MDKIQKDQNTQLPLLKSQKQKQGVRSKKQHTEHVPCTQHDQRGGQTPKPPLWSGPGTHPYLHPDKERAPSPSLGSEQGNVLLVFTPTCCSRGPNKGLPEFFVWPLINFY